MRTCTKCGTEIPAARLEALPDTETCVGCSTTKRKIGYMISNFSKGTAPEMAMVDPNDQEQIRLAKRANARRR